MYDLIGVAMLKELAEQTIFSPAALAKRDARPPARLLSKLLSKLRRHRQTEDNAPTFSNRIAKGTAHE